MIYLDPTILSSNMEAVVSAVGQVSSGNLRHDFLATVRQLQNVPAKIKSDQYCCEWDNEEMTQFLFQQRLLNSEEISGQSHFIAYDRRDTIMITLQKAMDILSYYQPIKYSMIQQLIGTVGLLELPEQDGGSVSSAIGYIYLSPKSSWSLSYFSEMIIHEFVHNSLFLIDMVQGIFPKLENLLIPEAQVTSVIKKVKRPYDKAFHSACVAAALIDFHSVIGNDTREQELRAGLRETVQELAYADQKCKMISCTIITDVAREITNELQEYSYHTR